jgi:hypothetical protein
MHLFYDYKMQNIRVVQMCINIALQSLTCHNLQMDYFENQVVQMDYFENQVVPFYMNQIESHLNLQSITPDKGGSLYLGI